MIEQDTGGIEYIIERRACEWRIKKIQTDVDISREDSGMEGARWRKSDRTRWWRNRVHYRKKGV